MYAQFRLDWMGCSVPKYLVRERKPFERLSTGVRYNDVTMSAMASQITSLIIVYSTVYSGADQRKHQSSASLAFVRGILRWPVNSPAHKASNAKNVSIWWRHHGYHTEPYFTNRDHWRLGYEYWITSKYNQEIPSVCHTSILQLRFNKTFTTGVIITQKTTDISNYSYLKTVPSIWPPLGKKGVNNIKHNGTIK